MIRVLALLFALLVAAPAPAQNVFSTGVNAGTQRVLGSLRGANFNVTTDQPIVISAPVYIVTAIWVTNCSTSMTTAVGGVYPTTAKGGTPLVAATQVYVALTAATVLQASTLNAAANLLTTRTTGSPIYLSLTTAQGSAATCDIYIIGQDLT
jgi:hypothetical protein